MRLLFLGDVVGRAGRDGVLSQLPALIDDLALDFVTVNAENAAGGFGITGKIAQEFYDVGVDVLTTGNHVWDQREIVAHIDRDDRLLRPLNFPPGTPGRGATLVEARNGARVLVINVMGRVFMDPLGDPFAAVDAELGLCRLKEAADAVIVDVHGEATSEKMAMGHFCDGRASLVVGTHSHVPTADAQILPGGTAYQTDAGMCGDYNSIIGMQKEEPLQRFTRKMPTQRYSPAEGEATVCGVVVDVDDATGLARVIEPVRVGGRLKVSRPAF